ncbi:dihydrodipicolinate synthase family protein [Paraburkholderia bannensis]|uniref:dihydrodipicolinate synthase family protein n=1 Tax=Paraburkholderia bannensis TaxID=765414 RepID=UPI002AC36FF5|nr:dihydrodipicolinate synthase family protein [Paraburkholderia bannensis]
MKFEGIYTPAITPIAVDGCVDREGFSEVIESLISAKVDGIVIGGSTGEYYAQTAQERVELATLAKQIIGNRTALIIGTGAVRTEDSIQYASHAKEIRADAILVSSPPYALPTEKENALHALAIDRMANLPIMLYNYPSRMGVMMGDEYFSRVGKSKNVVAIKESSGDMANVHLLARRFPQIELSCGWDDQALEFFAWGAKSWVCAGSNFLPHEHIALHRACVVEKDFAKGRAIMTAMLPMMDFLEKGKFVQSIKYGCELIGLPAGSVRAPLRPLRTEEKREFEVIVSHVKTTVAHIVSGVQHA